jgi:uncharacterized protein YcgL (UPF0745 family)
MKISTYSFKMNSGIFVCVEAAKGLAAVPDHIKSQHGGLIFFKEFELNEGDQIIVLDTKAALAGIATQGYYIQKTSISFEEK